MFKILAKLNKILLPSFTKQGLDISKAKKWQIAIIGYRAYVTKRALGN
ncbi:SsrA-binding protein [Flavobacterium endoglycinae]|uniref:SsrA-binding protein n=1 Tax=Flavobacterium endoglycinae TaxID=2816357 RepID=A0ABX7QEG1_9FLAO|nr:SsrA-binding protein [Flavobacterium endoglycinae]QSW88981.1 SsrA-binding protein [Flavobacterium endoglycinae]